MVINMKTELRHFTILGAFATLVASAVAAHVYWDTNQSTAGIGGTGLWTSAGNPKNWSTSSAGTANGDKWSDSASDVATFGGTAGTVTIDTASVPTITASLDFTTAGYTLAFADRSFTGLGTLSLNNTGVTTIDFGSTSATANTVAFTASSASTWTGTLTILNYSSTLDTLKFGSTASALTAAQLSKIHFNIGGTLYGAQISSLGVLTATAIPEPATTAMLGAIAVFGIAFYTRRQPATARN